MTAVDLPDSWYESVDIGKEPQLHAIVIGVGAYPHLKNVARRFGLQPLDSPAKSAVSIAAWLRDRYPELNKQRGLGSIELLTSSPSGASVEGAAQPSLHNIRKACKRWAMRSKAHKDNLAVFYFCGHGLYAGSHFLLADEFGNSETDNVWSEAIDFQQFASEAGKYGINRFVAFVDACAQLPADPSESIRGDTLLAATPPGEHSALNASYFAAEGGSLAYGLREDTSVYSGVIVSCLEGLAAVNCDSVWKIDAASLSSALLRVMRQKAHQNGMTFDPGQEIYDYDGSTLFEVQTPQVSVCIQHIGVDKKVADKTTIELTKGLAKFEVKASEPKPLRIHVPPGEYSVAAYTDASRVETNFLLVPPVFNGVKFV